MTSEGNTTHYCPGPPSLLDTPGGINTIPPAQGQNQTLPVVAPPNLLGNSFSLPHTSPPTNTSQNPPITSANILKISNLPPDITLREAHLIFSLVNDDIISIDLNDYIITALFKTLTTCITTGKLLNGKQVFGVKNPHVKVEFDSSLGISSANSAFENLRLSYSALSPSSSHLLSVQPPQGLLNLHLTSASSNSGFDSFQKRSSVGSQRLRFLFSDPFAGPNANAGALKASVQSAPGSIVLGDLTSKSLLMMSSQAEGREFDGLSRDPWGTLSLAFTSNPHTPGLSNVSNAFDWANTAPSNTQSQVQLQPQHSATQPSSGQRVNSSPPNLAQIPLNSASSNAATSDRRRTSAFFNGGQSTTAPASSQGAPQTTPISTGAPGLPSASTVQNSVSMTGPTSSVRNGNVCSQASVASNQVTESMTANNPACSLRQQLKEVPDLSLLAKVPPPANPADQNPPCNTLYVGNLPPDATEAELRALFSPQKGFRRLSFRTKNQSTNTGGGASGHNHGPMCFVEFEDVLLATEALADLYGSALPRSNSSSSKGGIRLSFSKNPLGVRGPSNARRSSANQLNSTSGSVNSGVGNYGYLNYR